MKLPLHWQQLQAPSGDHYAAATIRQSTLTKPEGSLGLLEQTAGRLAAIQRDSQPRTSPRWAVVFAADHGLTRDHAVSAYPREVTTQMVLNFARGGAAANVLSRLMAAELVVVDVGVDGPEFSSAPDSSANPRGARLLSRRVRRGTRNFLEESAMTPTECLQALDVGAEVARAASDRGARVLALGEMGIGNTTSAAAIAAALLGLEAARVVGRGTGVGDASLMLKQRLVSSALSLHDGYALAPADVLQALGGLEIAALVGAMLEAATLGIACVIDGFICSTAALVAQRVQPTLSGYLFASHRSREPGHQLVLEALGQPAPLELGMRLGEASGALLALGVLDASVATLNEMATFAEAAVSQRAP